MPTFGMYKTGLGKWWRAANKALYSNLSPLSNRKVHFKKWRKMTRSGDSDPWQYQWQR
ncbi:hypothetical protein FOCG_08658 [Fusarium oxysporum f. sp. radicis-lycopersici 26381]|uniref:Uncharacterized protein n=1 Tax=Fusarium oxysporum Fo47 TaxID=660027 RepID=W9JFE6_FUSOX|nr:hypothetical protein FOZG_17059 [Fusarium oxysporum Fo47]EXL50357.1 hypothetical protein FOCG_08658 [Fusarium oxysporum f. sp. radicis-lycopersici 26381]